MVLLGFYPSLWLFCPSGDCIREWHGSLDHGHPSNAGYTGVPVAIVTGSMVLLGFFLASGSSAPVRVEHEGSTAVWIMGTLAAPSEQGYQLPQLEELWSY